MKDICVVFISNYNYIKKFIFTVDQLLTNGKYKNDIVLLIGNDLYNTEIIEKIIITYPSLIIKYYQDIIFDDKFYEINNRVKSDERNITKRFQWHKIYLFDIFFKKWEYILYIDCGMKIFYDIEYIIKEKEKNKLIAHYDAYPKFEWKLRDQFDSTLEKFIELNNEFNLNIDYFQTTMMLYDTEIIKKDTFNNLYNLAKRFPISKTNEQGIIALYFTNIDNKYKPLRINNELYNLYDFIKRDINKEYIMIKY